MNDDTRAFPRPAFNVHGPNTTEWGCAQSGMTLRDYFAAKAMQAILGKAMRYDAEGQPGLAECGKQVVSDTAIAAYQIADAMLEHRLLPQKTP